MKKPWSISTTVRNPYRIRNFLLAAKKFEGKEWNKELLKNYQVELIKEKFYQPTSLPQKLREKYKNSEPISKQEAKETFGLMLERSDFLKKQPGVRGSMSLRPLEKLGFIIKQNNKLLLSETGRAFLQENFNLSEIFLKVLLKWQYPSWISKEFTKKQGYSIKPFVGTLHLINRVNKKWQEMGNKSCGITREEFTLFAQTLINHQDIDRQVERLLSFRNKINKYKTPKDKGQFKEKYKKKFTEEFLDTADEKHINKLLNNLKDYSDNSIRYFRLTSYIYIRGGGFYIDLEPRRQVEIEKLLESDNAKAFSFNNVKEYQTYIGDINKPILPWETEPELNRIAENTQEEIRHYEKELDSMAITRLKFIYKQIKNLHKEELKEYIRELREYRHKLQEIKTRFESQDPERIQEYIDSLKKIHEFSEGQRSIELEKLISLGLNTLNDALKIKPNYPIGDDNEPTFTAPANKSDIECFYEKFNSVCEVTLLTNRTQWYHEGQPVMRHMRDFEEEYSTKDAYCLFVSPRLHQDTLETFWIAVKYGYKGIKQKIIPLSLTQFIDLLETFLEIKKQKEEFKHTKLLELYDKIIKQSEDVEHSGMWLQKIPEILKSWKESTLSKS